MSYENERLIWNTFGRDFPLTTDKNNIESVLEERGTRYAKFIDNATVAQNIKDAMMVDTKFYQMGADQKEALHQIAAKISRAVTGDPNYQDNWVDIIGYSTLVLNRLKEKQP